MELSHSTGRHCRAVWPDVGDASKLDELVAMLDTFEFWFNIVTPVAAN
jgi:alkyl sulfatase BDS1-like metallo-beta-lactamase superfamily hydrolase